MFEMYNWKWHVNNTIYRFFPQRSPAASCFKFYWLCWMTYIEEVLGPQETEGQFLSEAIDPISLVPVGQLNIWGQNNIITGKPIRPTLRSDYIHLANSWRAHSSVSQSPPLSVFLSVHEMMQPVKTSKYVTRTRCVHSASANFQCWANVNFVNIAENSFLIEHTGATASFGP